MNLRVNLNDMKYRYGIYQILNTYYNLWNITFEEENYDIKINIEDNFILIEDEEGKHIYDLKKDIEDITYNQ